jgi:transposase, IS6 family
LYLSPKRNAAGAKRFLATILRSTPSAGYPWEISTDKAPAPVKAIAELKAERICPPTVEHPQVKYLDNMLEGEHGG